MTNPRRLSFLLAAALPFTLQAEVLVYEGFDPSDPGVSLDSGQLAGATTMWERWNSYTKERGFGDVGMNSFNHYAYGAVGEWMYSVIGGIRLLAPGFKKILFAPEPGGGLTSAECRLETPQGRAECRWHLRGLTLRGEVCVPPATTAELQLPGRRARKLSSGRHRFSAKIKAS